MNCTIGRELAAGTETRTQIFYSFTTYDIERGKIYLDKVEMKILPKGKKKWQTVVLYSRLERGRNTTDREADVPQDVLDEAIDLIRKSIRFSLWEDRDK